MSNKTIKEDIKLRSDVLYHIFEAKEAAKKLDSAAEYLGVLDNMITYFNTSILNVVNERVGNNAWEICSVGYLENKRYIVVNQDESIVHELGTMNNIDESIDAAVEFIGIVGKGR